MPQFNLIYNEYETTKDVCKFCDYYRENNIATRFLLIRSLDKPNLKELIELYSDTDTTGNAKQLTEKVYNSSITIPQLVEYIESKRTILISQRERELEGLSDVLTSFPIVNCGVRNDKVDDIVKAFVRNKTLKSYNALANELDNSLLPRIRQYSLWSYYNQTANDIIELFFLKHASVLPTLRKIHDIDFFLKVDGQIIPFDLKFTHISDSYFNLASQGIIKTPSESADDDFYIFDNSENNEIKRIKAFYTQFKRLHRQFSLPKLSGLIKMIFANCSCILVIQMPLLLSII